jgi:integral membrane sensor domain MASE1
MHSDSKLLVCNATIGFLASFFATIISPANDPWPICYIFFPVMQFAGIPGVLILVVILLLFIAVIASVIRASICFTPQRKNTALTLTHIFLLVTFLVPSAFEAFGKYIGP